LGFVYFIARRAENAQSKSRYKYQLSFVGAMFMSVFPTPYSLVTAKRSKTQISKASWKQDRVYGSAFNLNAWSQCKAEQGKLKQ
jgi:hypothetical protein